jgi:oligoendopeptidase F
LADWFDLVERVGRSLGKIVVYAGMQHHVDTTDQAAAAKNDRARGLFARVMATMAFAEPEMLSIGFEKLRQWMKEEPRLAIYGHYFDELERRKEHIRSAEVEELLRQVMDPFRTAAATHGILSDAELTFKPAAGGHEITHSTHRHSPASSRSGSAPDSVGELLRCVLSVQEHNGQLHRRGGQAERLHGPGAKI